jgi:uncharacterized protein (TIGR02996 family)
MDTGEQLRAQIWQNPTDRQLLSVYADWLVGKGQETRAEYIHLSVLARRTQAQNNRRTALRNKHRGAWLGPARPYVWTWEEDDLSPGFVAKAQCQMAKLTAGFELVRALGPRLVVAVTAPKARRETLAFAERPLGTLWGLAFYELDAQWITDELMMTIAPKLGGLRELVLHVGEMRASDRGWQAMLQHLDVLQHLDLTMGENPERWLELLLARRLPLRTLSVPSWIDRPLRTRLERAIPTVLLRRQGRHWFNRATGQYEWRN